MSHQGPIIVVTDAGRPAFVRALDAAGMFPIIDTARPDASRAVEQLAPAAIIIASEVVPSGFEALAKQVATRKPYLPLIAIDPRTSLPANAIPFSASGGSFDRLPARLRAVLRIRSLHSTVIRRLDGDPAGRTAPAVEDCAGDASVLLIGRGA